MVFDTHTHLDFSGEIDNARRLMASLRRADIDKAFVFAGNHCCTARLLAEVRPYKDSLLPIGSVSPLAARKPSLNQIRVWLESDKIYGLKFYPGYEYFYPSDDVVKPYLALLQKYNKLAIFHSGDTHRSDKSAKLKYSHPLHIDEAAVSFPKLKIVIAHLGFPWIVDTAQVMSKNENVYADCSGLFYDKPSARDYELLKKVFSQFLDFGGPIERVFFGTDWSVADQRSYVRFISSLKLGDKAKKKILYRNIAELVL